VWLHVHRGASREALGRRGRDEPPEHAAPLPAAPPRGSRGTSEGIRERRRDGAVLHAQGEDARRRAKQAQSGWRWRETGLAAGPSGSSRCPGRDFGCEPATRPSGSSRRPGRDFARERAGPNGSSPSPGEVQGSHPVERGCPLSRLSYPVGDRGCGPGGYGGVLGALISNALGDRARGRDLALIRTSSSPPLAPSACRPGRS